VGSLDDFARDKLAHSERRGLRRKPVESVALDAVRIERGGRELLSFSGNDYLGLSFCPEVQRAAREALERYGCGAGASRLITGNHPLLGALERALSELKGSEDAVVFGSGYLTNLGLIPALCGPEDLIVADALSHACLLAGARLSGATLLCYAHENMAEVRAVLEARRGRHRHCLILTDGVFSMDGDLANLPELARLAERFDAWLLCDDAHGLGVVGGGRGSAFAHSEALTIALQMGTLSKAAGGYGGYVCASRVVCELLRTRARTFIYSTGLAPASAGAALAAVRRIAGDRALCARPLAHARRFCGRLGLPAPRSPIVPIVVGDGGRALELSARLERRGFLVVAIREPTVPRGTARLRITFSAAHRLEHVDALAEALGEELT